MKKETGFRILEALTTKQYTHTHTHTHTHTLNHRRSSLLPIFFFFPLVRSISLFFRFFTFLLFFFYGTCTIVFFLAVFLPSSSTSFSRYLTVTGVYEGHPVSFWTRRSGRLYGFLNQSFFLKAVIPLSKHPLGHDFKPCDHSARPR